MFVTVTFRRPMLMGEIAFRVRVTDSRRATAC
jgi:hypothetical protein